MEEPGGRRATEKYPFGLKLDVGGNLSGLHDHQIRMAKLLLTHPQKRLGLRCSGNLKVCQENLSSILLALFPVPHPPPTPALCRSWTSSCSPLPHYTVCSARYPYESFTPALEDSYWVTSCVNFWVIFSEGFLFNLRPPFLKKKI